MLVGHKISVNIIQNNRWTMLGRFALAAQPSDPNPSKQTIRSGIGRTVEHVTMSDQKSSAKCTSGLGL